jgi:hypothetical protein
MSRVRISVEGHYEMQEVPYGRDYVWKPAHAVIECGCGQVMDANVHHTACPKCGADHAAVVREVVGRHLADEVLHPWHPEYEDWVRHRKDEGRLSELDELE